MSFSTTAEFDEAYAAVRAGFATGKTLDKKWRKRQLQKVYYMIEDNKERILEALQKDLNKHRYEAIMEVNALQTDVLHTLDKLDAWTADERPGGDFLNFMSRTTIRKEPLGVSLIIGAWNFPFVLLLQPMIAAIAAGCTIVLKPSDLAVASQDLILEIVPKYLEADAVRAISAGPKEMGYVLEHRFDQIFYTGSAHVAKIVSAAAAKHLTPVTLELGGQGPAIVTAKANVKLAAKRIAAAKLMNAGQVCLNVNHVFVDPAVHDEFIQHISAYYDEYLGGRDGKPDYLTHIINERNFNRLETLLKGTSGKVAYEASRDSSTRFFGPVVVENVTMQDSLMSEELFGPILPVIKATMTEAVAIIRSMEHPLSLYPFTDSQAEKDYIVRSTKSGGVTFNDWFLHANAKDAPFGGVGNSGSGAYHGRFGILQFSHNRTYMDPPTWLDSIMSFRYPPYTLDASKKMETCGAAPFDRDGKPIRSTASWLAAIAAVGVAAWGLQKTGRLPAFSLN
ncbi:hypothetical protein jhhlp_001764 [Lomentospora prolificans]|uniref:Aldehyde dehydrogenase n=1 Tax=Lomentospora prolificans TaxID=41688 RepID=A0A2N3NGR3_9PEZI|nr:hypothetical protein jhhlp_001764 [Lomentospora prolificans]